jgi:dipeptidyl aminopeptidase/acylaminoacyl peptidase
MKTKVLFLFMFLLTLTGSAKNKIYLKEMGRYGGFRISHPVLCDSINVKGEKYASKSLLKATLNEPKQYPTWPVGADSVFHAEKPPMDQELSLWHFYVEPEEFLPLTLQIKSPNLFEVFVDGEKRTDKSTQEVTWGKAKSATVSLHADPRQYEILIKMLASADDSCETMLSVSIETEKRDSDVMVTASASGRRHLFTPDFLAGQRIWGTALSPNGKFCLLSYGITCKDGSTSHCAELTELSSGKTIWREEPNDRQLSWMPKSNLLYYISKNADRRELRTLDPVTQQEQTLVNNLPEGTFQWSPNEQFLIYTLSETAPIDKGDLRRLVNPEDRQTDFRSRRSLYQYDLKTGLLRRLTYGKDDAYLSDISLDGQTLAYGLKTAFITEAPFSDVSMFLLHLNTLKVDTLWMHDKDNYNVTFSPDGKKILIKGNPNSFGGIGLNIDPNQKANTYDGQAFLMDLSTRKVEAITKNFDPAILYGQWSPMDGKIYFKVEDKDYVRIFAYDPLKKTFTRLPLPCDIVSGFDLGRTSLKATFYGSTTSYTGKAYAFDLKTMKATLLASPGDERLAQVEIGQTGDWNFQAADHSLIEGRYYLPPHFDPTRKYPLLVYYYGGTSPTSRTFEGNYPLHLYAAMGYVVYTLNPSGTTGYGQAFSARHVNAWGDYTADEIIRGTQLFCREHPFADSTRMGCFGASYGGFMTMYLQTKTTMFKAAVSHAGISSLASYWGEGYWGYTYNSAAAAGSYPWNNPELFWEHSPLYHADQIQTPLLLLHGSADTNVPIGESIQLFTALKIMGKEVEFVRIEGENHSVRNFSRKLEWQRTILAFFAKYLKGDDRWWKELYPNTIKE